MYDTTVNDEALTARMAPVLKRAADGQVAQAPLVGASEDFSFFAKEVPGLYVFLGVTPRDQDPAKAAPNHNPEFFVDESALVVGTRTMAFLAANFLESGAEEEADAGYGSRPLFRRNPDLLLVLGYLFELAKKARVFANKLSYAVCNERVAASFDISPTHQRDNNCPDRVDNQVDDRVAVRPFPS